MKYKRRASIDIGDSYLVFTSVLENGIQMCKMYDKETGKLIPYIASTDERSVLSVLLHAGCGKEVDIEFESEDD